MQQLTTRHVAPLTLSPAFGLVLWCTLVVASALASPLCPRGMQFWDASQQTCANCTSCSPGQVVLRPCQPHIDTFCGPLSALRIDWSWVRPQKQSLSPSSSVAPRAVKPVRKKVTISSSTTSTSTTIVPVTTEQFLRVEPTEATTVFQMEEQISSTQPQSPSSSPSSLQLPALLPRPVVSAQPFSAAETLVWDWQALTLVVAVTSCALFLLLLVSYAVYQARAATGRRRNLQQDLDEATAHLSLFTVGPADQPGLDAGLPQGAPEPAGLYATNQCLYLEKLLERKQRQNERGVRGNIYVETGRQATPAPARRSTRWKAQQGGLR